MIKLFIPVFYNAIMAFFVYIADKKTPFNKLNNAIKQLIIGTLFGCLAAVSTEYGMDIGSAIVNVRDASPLCAGLIFGGPAGIIAGVIGGIYRWCAAIWGAGMYTRLSCSVSCVACGFIAAILRRYMFDDKKPKGFYALGIAMVCEVMHMVMIFLTNMNDANNAFEIVRQASLPMVLCNGAAVYFSVILISAANNNKLTLDRHKRHIAETFQAWLLVCILFAFAACSCFTWMLQTRMTNNQTSSTIAQTLSDVHSDILDTADENMLTIIRLVRSDYLMLDEVNNNTLSFLAYKYGVESVCIIDKNGIISYANEDRLIGFDMSSGEQSAEFLQLLDGKTTELVQEYRQISSDNKIGRKYAGIALPEGGFLQIGYNGSQLQKNIDSRVGMATKNRHIGSEGAVIICDEKWMTVSNDEALNDKSLEDLGLKIDRSSMHANEMYNGTYNGKACYVMYTPAEGYYIIGVSTCSEADFMRDVSIYLSVFMEILIFAVLFGIIYFLIKSVIIDNIRSINKSLSKITNGDLDARVDVRSSEEFASLSDDINTTVSTLKRYIAEAAARIDRELEFAREIQHSSLPSVFPPYPNHKEFDIYASMFTAKEVGGDFYDFYFVSEDKIAFVIADVSGKGIPAAMFMMRAKTVLKDLAESGKPIDEVFTLANRALCENNDAGMFVTAWMGYLDIKTGEINFANAGHNPPILCRANGGFELFKTKASLVLAGMDGIKYRASSLRLKKGDTLWLYTDGVTEATNSNNELYGENRLLRAANSNRGADMETLCKNIKTDVDRFVGKAEQFDDITMLGIKYEGGEEIDEGN